MLLFRADKMDFEVGDVFTTAGHCFDKFPEKTKLLEQRLEDFRPNDKPRRIDCLFLFESLDLAKRHWSIMEQGKLMTRNARHFEASGALVLDPWQHSCSAHPQPGIPSYG